MEIKIHLNIRKRLCIPQNYVDIIKKLIMDNGWKYNTTLKRNGKLIADFYIKDDVELLIPLQMDFIDFEERFNELIKNFAKGMKYDEESAYEIFSFSMKGIETNSGD